MMAGPENSGKKQSGRFRKGQSGNPTGKPKGTRHKATVLAEKLLSDDLEEVARSVISAAKGGDMAAARMIFERLIPVRKGVPVVLDLPEMKNSQDVLTGLDAVVRAMAAGQITPEEASTVAGVLEAKAKGMELVEFEIRLAALEDQLKAQQQGS